MDHVPSQPGYGLGIVWGYYRNARSQLVTDFLPVYTSKVKTEGVLCRVEPIMLIFPPIINPRRACAARVTVSVCLLVLI